MLFRSDVSIDSSQFDSHDALLILMVSRHDRELHFMYSGYNIFICPTTFHAQRCVYRSSDEYAVRASKLHPSLAASAPRSQSVSLHSNPAVARNVSISGTTIQAY